MSMKNFIFTLLGLLVSCCLSAQNRTLVAYYSYTGNVKAITNELKNLISADFVEILPTEEGVKYEANNYAIGSALISAIRNNPDNADSYPEIKSIDIEFSQYDNIIIATPLWWSNMAAPMQTFLFNNGGEMNGKNISLIVSSASSSIQSVVDDAKRLIPDGIFSNESLWINNSNRSNMPTLLDNWIKSTTLPLDKHGTSVNTIKISNISNSNMYDLQGRLIKSPQKGQVYIQNGEKWMSLPHVYKPMVIR